MKVRVTGESTQPHNNSKTEEMQVPMRIHIHTYIHKHTVGG